MAHLTRRRARAIRDQRSGRLLAAAVASILAGFVLAPWLAGRLTPWPWAPAAAAFLVLVPAVHFWFRRVQRTPHRTAILLAVVYSALSAGLWWLWGRA